MTTLNRYSYCYNRPVSLVDPAGTFPVKELIAAILDPILNSKVEDLLPWLPDWPDPPFTILPPFVNLDPPYPIPYPSIGAEIATNCFIVLAEWGAETFWGPPNGPRPNEDIIISPIEALIARRSGLTKADLGL